MTWGAEEGSQGIGKTMKENLLKNVLIFVRSQIMENRRGKNHTSTKVGF